MFTNFFTGHAFVLNQIDYAGSDVLHYHQQFDLSILDARPWMSIPDTNSARPCLSILDNVFMSSHVSVSLTVPASVSFSIPDSVCLCFNIPYVSTYVSVSLTVPACVSVSLTEPP